MGRSTQEEKGFGGAWNKGLSPGNDTLYVKLAAGTQSSNIEMSTKPQLCLEVISIQVVLDAKRLVVITWEFGNNNYHIMNYSAKFHGLNLEYSNMERSGGRRQQ